ncbi:pyridoxal-phosphate dependent enzyme [Clostridium sp. FAM 1755]|uniref:threonine synthase n=1 Tax=Clostridium caseinilyticum TaxID=3350403 RepID=UPI0038F77CFD
MIERNKSIKNLYCIRCNKKYEISDYFRGCEKCLNDGLPASVTFNYGVGESVNNINEMFPYSMQSILGEGNTPIISHKKISDIYGIESFYLKNEFQNPTGSHKDRMSPYIVARAIEMKRKGVVVASSGNAGISIASYASYKGVKSIVVTTKGINPVYERAIEATGAQIIITETSDERWNIVKKLVDIEGWYPATNYINPPVGSNPFGVQGYKKIAFEIYEFFNEKLPTHILIPVSRGDLLWGVYEGFKNLLQLGYIIEIPKLIAVEPIPRIESVLKGKSYIKKFKGDYSKTPSIGGDTVTYQSIKAIKETNGCAITVNAEKIPSALKLIGSSGVYLETSSALAIQGLCILRGKEIINENSRVLMIATSHGYKN